MSLSNKVFYLGWFCLSVLFSVTGYSSSITVNPLTLVFESAEDRYQDIKIFNTGDDIAYVNIESFKLEHPGSDDSQLLAMKADPISFGLVVTPNKMIIPKGESRIVRVMRLLQGNRLDGVYQIKIVPATGELQAVTDQKDNIVAGVHVVVGYTVSVRVLPVQPKVELSVTRHGKDVTVTNTGNTSVLLSEGLQCDLPEGGDKKNCQELPVKRIYAESTWQFKLPLDLGFSYQKTYLGHQEFLQVP